MGDTRAPRPGAPGGPTVDRGGGETTWAPSGESASPQERWRQMSDERTQIAGDLKRRSTVQRKASGSGAATGAAGSTGAGSAAARAASVSTSGGAPVDAGVRARVEQSTGASLADVRVHTGAESARAADGIQAHAYTVGRDVHFAAGQYRPGSGDGQRLLAHELVHTIQQGASAGAPQAKPRISQPGDAAEREADSVADAALRGERAVSVERTGDLSRTPGDLTVPSLSAPGDLHAPHTGGGPRLFPGHDGASAPRRHGARRATPRSGQLGMISTRVRPKSGGGAGHGHSTGGAGHGHLTGGAGHGHSTGGAGHGHSTGGAGHGHSTGGAGHARATGSAPSTGPATGAPSTGGATPAPAPSTGTASAAPSTAPATSAPSTGGAAPAPAPSTGGAAPAPSTGGTRAAPSTGGARAAAPSTGSGEHATEGGEAEQAHLEMGLEGSGGITTSTPLGPTSPDDPPDHAIHPTYQVSLYAEWAGARAHHDGRISLLSDPNVSIVGVAGGSGDPVEFELAVAVKVFSAAITDRLQLQLEAEAHGSVDSDGGASAGGELGFGFEGEIDEHSSVSVSGTFGLTFPDHGPPEAEVGVQLGFTVHP